MLRFANLDTSAALLSWRKKKAVQVDIMKAWAALQEDRFIVSILFRGFPIAHLCSLPLKKTYRRKIPPGFSSREVHTSSPKMKECIYMNLVTMGTAPALTRVQSYRFCFHVLNSSQLHLTMPLSLPFALISLIFFIFLLISQCKNISGIWQLPNARI